MKRFLIIVIFIFLYGLVGFFGLGPVLMADGSSTERMITLIVILIILLVLSFILYLLLRKRK